MHIEKDGLHDIIFDQACLDRIVGFSDNDPLWIGQIQIWKSLAYIPKHIGPSAQRLDRLVIQLDSGFNFGCHIQD